MRLLTRRLRAVAVLSTVTLSTSLLASAQPAAAAYAAPKAISATPFTITADYNQYATVNSALDALLPNVTVHTVMTAANHDREPLCHKDTLGALSGSVTGFCFDAADTGDCHTFPQGLTTTRDATGGEYDGHQLVAVSWYQKSGCTSGASTIRDKITLVDWDADHPNKYRKLMLVQPYTDTQGRPNFRAYTLHATNISWYGDHLYMTNATAGLVIFDMRKIWQVKVGDGIGRQADGSYESAGYTYVLPAVGTVRNTGTTGLRWSTLGLDRVGPSFVTTEWIETGDPARHAVRFPLDPTTRRFASGTVRATQALSYTYPHVQGAVSHNGRWWFGASLPKALYYWTPAGGARTYSWVSVTQGLSYWEDASGPDLLWTLRENENTRNVFAVEQATYS